MSIFTRCQSLAHPEWLPQFFKDFDSQTALIKNGTLPEVLHFPFLAVLACRIHSCTQCEELHPFDATGDDEWTCSGCGWKTDFSGLMEMTPDEEI